jgi:hypothetical protein
LVRILHCHGAVAHNPRVPPPRFFSSTPIKFGFTCRGLVRRGQLDPRNIAGYTLTIQTRKNSRS